MQTPWLVGLGELQTMGEALRMDPLALPTALRKIARPPWPENLDLLDCVGAVRQSEEATQGQEEPDLDGTEFMLLRGRMMAARQSVPAPALAGWIEVTRWEGVEDPVIYCSRDLDEFALLVHSLNRYCWITCPGSLEQRYELLPVVATALAYWLARVFETGFALRLALKGQVYTRFHLELDRRPGPQLAIALADDGTRIVLGPGFVEALCRGDNDSDRMLLGAVLSSAEAFVEGDAASVLDQIVPEGRGTVAVWSHPEATSNPPRLDPLPPVEQRFRQEIERGMASAADGEGKGIVVSGERLAPVLEKLAQGLENGIQDRLDSLEPAALRDLVSLHERAIHQSTLEAIQLPARSVLQFAETYPEFGHAVLHRDLVLRVLIERASALPPRGSEPFSRRHGSWLRAATELQLELRGALDAVRWEKAGGRVTVSPELGIVLELGGELPDASRAMKDQMIASAPDQMAEMHSDWWGEERPELGPPPALDEPIALPAAWAKVDLAMADEWGVSLEQIVRLLHALAAIADEQPDCVDCSAVDRLATELAKRSAIPAEAVASAIECLTLSPCPEFDTFEEEHQPGRANRERSYLRRPLVALPDGELCWSSLHCKRAAEYLSSLIASGRLQAPGPLGSVVRAISQRLDREFEKAVLAGVDDCEWQGESSLEQLGGVPLRRRRGEEIGDIDVLAWSPERREVWLLDAKRLNPGVQPGPMLKEAPTFEKYIERHEERLQWVRNHLPELAQQIKVETVDGWEIRAALVLDRPLAGAHLGQLSLPIWTLWSLPRQLDQDSLL